MEDRPGRGAEEEEEEQPLPPLPSPATFESELAHCRRQTDQVLQLLQDAADERGMNARAKEAILQTQQHLAQLQRMHEEWLRLLLVHVAENARLHPVAEDAGAALFHSVYRR